MPTTRQLHPSCRASAPLFRLVLRFVPSTFVCLTPMPCSETKLLQRRPCNARLSGNYLDACFLQPPAMGLQAYPGQHATFGSQQHDVLLQVPLASLQAIDGVGANVPGAQRMLPIFHHHTNASAAPGIVLVLAPFCFLAPDSDFGKLPVSWCRGSCCPFQADSA